VFASARTIVFTHLSLRSQQHARSLWTAQAFQFPEPGFSGGDAESYYGNIQVEIGSNNDVNFKGKNKSKAHQGQCMLNTSLYLEGELFVDKGVFVSKELR
jgi:hypothetical protein